MKTSYWLPLLLLSLISITALVFSIYNFSSPKSSSSITESTVIAELKDSLASIAIEAVESSDVVTLNTQKKSALPFVEEIVDVHMLNANSRLASKYNSGARVLDSSTLDYYTVANGMFSLNVDISVDQNIPIYIAKSKQWIIPSQYKKNRALETLHIDIDESLEYNADGTLGISKPHAQNSYLFYDGVKWNSKTRTSLIHSMSFTDKTIEIVGDTKFLLTSFDVTNELSEDLYQIIISLKNGTPDYTGDGATLSLIGDGHNILTSINITDTKSVSTDFVTEVSIDLSARTQIDVYLTVPINTCMILRYFSFRKH